jgi:hypothetical protein
MDLAGEKSGKDAGRRESSVFNRQESGSRSGELPGTSRMSPIFYWVPGWPAPIGSRGAVLHSERVWQVVIGSVEAREVSSPDNDLGASTLHGTPNRRRAPEYLIREEESSGTGNGEGPFVRASVKQPAYIKNLHAATLPQPRSEGVSMHNSGATHRQGKKVTILPWAVSMKE